MEIFRAPRVTLLARPEFLEPEHLRVEWRGEASPGERLAEYAGRLCYMSQHNPAKRTTGEYLENIKRQGHGSVLEHSVYVLLIEGISRSCSHELVRHRAGFGYSQISQRYVDESHAAFVMPPAIVGDATFEAEWEQQVVAAQAGGDVVGNRRGVGTDLQIGDWRPIGRGKYNAGIEDAQRVVRPLEVAEQRHDLGAVETLHQSRPQPAVAVLPAGRASEPHQ